MLAAVAGSIIQFGQGAILGLPGVILPALMDPNAEDLVLTMEDAELFGRKKLSDLQITFK